jgi:glycosyltransferase involved in cell wall biosynthesis
MNILLINDYLEHGGAEAVFREQYDILQKDFHVEMFYAFENVSEKKISPASYIYSFHFRKKLATFLQNRLFDVVIIHNYNSALSPAALDALSHYKKRTKCRIIYYAHDYHLICPNRGYNYVKKNKLINFNSPPSFWDIISKRMDSKGAIFSVLKKLQWILAYPLGKKQKVFDLILSPSDFLAHRIQLTYPDRVVERMYNPCYALEFTPKEKLKTSDGTLRMVYFGRLDPVKGLSGFIEALKNSSVDYRFTIIGEGEEEYVIKEMITRLQLQDKILLKSKLKREDLFAELQNYDVFVLPSLWYENAPLSIVEAASIGLGLFLSNHGGVLEIGKICNAVHFFNPFDRQDIVSQLGVLYKDFIAGALPEVDRKKLDVLFSKKTYIENLKKNCIFTA